MAVSALRPLAPMEIIAGSCLFREQELCRLHHEFDAKDLAAPPDDLAFLPLVDGMEKSKFEAVGNLRTVIDDHLCAGR
jgi:hypothetical protein